MTAQSIKFNNSFTQTAEDYLKECKKKKTQSSLEEFAKKIGTDSETVLAWSGKKKKDEQGNLTEELARPKFYSAVGKINQTKVGQPAKKEEKEKSEEEIKLNPKQELFCQLYTTDKDFFGNGVMTYAEAYDLDINIPKNYNTAKTNAWRLLTNADILKRIDQLLELGPLNDTFVDRQLARVIAQDADFSSKVSAIREYNKLKQRITDKLQVDGNITVEMTDYESTKS